MSYFGIGYPRMQLRNPADGSVYADYELPYPTWRLFKPVLVNDPEMNPITHNMLERRFGWHLEFTFHWDIVQDHADLAKLIRIVSNTTREIWLYPHHEISALEYEVILLDTDFPLLSGKTAYQGFEMKLQTAELQSEIEEIYSLFVGSEPSHRTVV
ncbi:MAG TPA: hypothetical protein PLP19_05655 [bacterium]|nr:hypothetical protein [bacterium]HPN42952.1 hypothetical protein [bacterium]